MSKSKSTEKSGANQYYLLMGALTIVYLLLTFFSPIDPASLKRFNINEVQTRLLQLSLAVPILAIYYTAVYGAVRFKTYSLTIKGSPDGKAYDALANGLLALVFIGLVFPGIFGTLASYARAAGMRETFTVVNRYVSVGANLLAFYLLFRGSQAVLAYAKGKQKTHWLTWVSVLGGGLYTYVLLNYPYRNKTPDPTKYSSFYMTDPQLLLTVVLPTVAAWVLASLAVSNIVEYTKTVKGVIYKKALSSLSNGVTAVVLVLISLQMLTGLSEAFSNLDLKGILIFIYVILIAYAIGWVIIARGAKKLSKIEEVV